MYMKLDMARLASWYIKGVVIIIISKGAVLIRGIELNAIENMHSSKILMAQ